MQECHPRVYRENLGTLVELRILQYPSICRVVRTTAFLDEGDFDALGGATRLSCELHTGMHVSSRSTSKSELLHA